MIPLRSQNTRVIMYTVLLNRFCTPTLPVYLFSHTLCTYCIVYMFSSIAYEPMAYGINELEMNLFTYGIGSFCFSVIHCVPRAPFCEVSSRVYLSAYCLNPQNTMHFTRFSQFRLYVAMAMTKPGKMHCVIRILTIDEQRRNLAHWGSRNTV